MKFYFQCVLRQKKAKAKCKGDYRDLRKRQKIKRFKISNTKKGVLSPHFNPEATMLVVDTKSNLYLLEKCQILEELDHNINSEQSMCHKNTDRGYSKE